MMGHYVTYDGTLYNIGSFDPIGLNLSHDTQLHKIDHMMHKYDGTLHNMEL